MQLTASFSLDLEKLNFYGSRDEIRNTIYSRAFKTSTNFGFSFSRRENKNKNTEKRSEEKLHFKNRKHNQKR